MIRPLFLAALDPFDVIEEPLLSVAAVLLIFVSVAWIIMSRLITHEMKKAAYRALNNKTSRKAKPSRDIWSSPP